MKKPIPLKRILFLLFLAATFLWVAANRNFNEPNEPKTYPTMKQDTNDRYLGRGQIQIANQDGYFTLFSTMEDHQKTFKEYKQNGDASWSGEAYWDGTMADYGCGITVMSILLSGYQHPYTPEDLRKKYYPRLDGLQMAEELAETFAIENTGFLYSKDAFSEEKIVNHLKSNRPIIVCVWNKPTENRWTTASHYLLLLATDGENMVYVSNPNGLEDSSKSSGWYPLSEIIPFIAKIMYIETF